MQEELLQLIPDRILLRHIISTLVLFVTVFGIRYIILRFVRGRLPTRDTLQLRWTSQVRAFSYVILAFGLFTIWAAELQALPRRPPDFAANLPAPAAAARRLATAARR